MLSSVQKNRIIDVLLDLGITPKLKGFNYIVDAVEYMLNYKDCNIMEVYDYLSDKYKVNNSERNIRHAFSKCDENSLVYKQWFGHAKTNSERLTTLALKIGRM